MVFQRIIFLLLFFGLSSCLAMGQRLVELSGASGWIRQESHMTMDQLKDKARQLAKINSIEKVFGSFVQQQTDMTVKEGKDAFYIIGTTKVRGEWIMTIHEEFSIKTETNKAGIGNPEEIYIKCEIQGKGRKAPPSIDFNFEALKCPSLACQTEAFQTNDPFYLYFKSPIDGYLTVFMEEEDSVRRLLPYSAMTGTLNNCLPIKADKEYVFFDKGQSEWPKATIDDIIMICKNQEKPERNTLWIIFSSEIFYKPGLSHGGKMGDLILPTALSINDFNQWRANNSAREAGFQSKNTVITIQPKL